MAEKAAGRSAFSRWLERYVRFRTSTWFAMFMALFVGLWIVDAIASIPGLPPLDTPDLKVLNIFLYMETVVSAAFVRVVMQRQEDSHREQLRFIMNAMLAQREVLTSMRDMLASRRGETS